MPPNEAPEPTPPPPMPASALSSQEEPPDLGKSIKRRIYQWWGVPGLIVFALIFLIVTNWSMVKEFPVVSAFLQWLSQEPLPKADPTRFTVALAHLEHDKEQQEE